MSDQTDQPLLTSDDLTEEQRAWMPASSEELAGQWPMAHEIENWDGIPVFYALEEWDWRSVALAARAFPNVRVELRNPWLLAVPLDRRDGHRPLDAELPHSSDDQPVT